MEANQQMLSDEIRKLLRVVSCDRADEIDTLFDELTPVFEVDRITEKTCFQAISGTPNIIRIGFNCTVRLQAHAYASGIYFNAKATLGYEKMSLEERHQLTAPADQFLNWAVGRDLQRWLCHRGQELDPKHVSAIASNHLPIEAINSLDNSQRILGEGLFRYALAFILLHELGHLKYGHSSSTLDNEKQVDRFAAEWMSEAAFDSSGNVESDRLSALFGCAISLLWLTTQNIYFGDTEINSHPQGYNRLWQVLDEVIDQSNDDEQEIVWDIVSDLLFIHMDAAGFPFDDKHDGIHLQTTPKDQVNYLINRISNWDHQR